MNDINIEEIINNLKSIYKLEINHEFEGLHYLERTDLYVCIIEPHEGTDFRYVFRADYSETFDRWGVCLFQEYFNSKKEFYNVLNKFTEFIIDKDKNIKEELEDNSNE